MRTHGAPSKAGWQSAPIGVGLILLTAFVLFPMYWMVRTSLTPLGDVLQFPPKWISSDWTLDAYRSLVGNPTMLLYLRNSLIVSISGAFGAVIVSAHAAYAFSKFRFAGRRSMMYLVLAGQMLPEALLLISLAGLFASLGLLETYSALILSFISFTLPLCIFILKSYFDKIPEEILEAAKVDGASQRQVMWKIVAPLIRPGLVAAGLFAFIRCWSDFIYALTLGGTSRMTLPPGILTEYGADITSLWPEIMAASAVTAFPVMAAFMFLQKHFIEGLTAGSVKG